MRHPWIRLSFFVLLTTSLFACAQPFEQAPDGPPAAPLAEQQPEPTTCIEANPTAASAELHAEPSEFEASRGVLYFSTGHDEEAGIFRLSLPSGEAERIAEGLSWPFHVHGRYLVYSAVVTEPPPGAQVESGSFVPYEWTALDLVSKTTRPLGRGVPHSTGAFDAEGRFVFLSKGQITRWTLHAEEPETWAVGDDALGPLRSDGTRVFVTDSPDRQRTRVRRLDEAAATLVPFADVEGPVGDKRVLDVKGDELYVNDRATGLLFVTDRQGTRIRDLVQLGTDDDDRPLFHFAADAIYVFTASRRELVRIDRQSGAKTSLATMSEPGFRLTSDACYVYTATIAGHVERIPKP